MSSVFGQEYSAAYDALYAEKDYEAECDLLEGIAEGGSRQLEILDLGCGTGSHATVLARRGHTVVGVDRSPAMLDRARAKAESVGADLRLEEGDIRTVRLGHEFDLVVSMFAVIGYQLQNEDVMAALHTARAHMSVGSTFVFDAWYGPAVVSTGPGERIKVLEGEESTLIRVSSGELRPLDHTCNVKMSVWRVAGGRVERTTEEHRMRFFYPKEIEMLLGLAGMELVDLARFPENDRPPSLHDWNVLVTARAV